ncbi:MAG TPA: hypothetical protein VGF61_24885 [Candidatus Acidoferrum sp.]|jgi:hypothetical protein
MILGVHLEVFLALTYAMFLVGVAFSLECLAGHSQKRAERYRNSGFIYFRELDYWECPAGRQLVQLHTDHQRQIVTYRAPATACNSCSLKLNCTDSEEGRILERRFDSWIESELRRFHRGISVALLLLAIIILFGEIIRYPQLHDREPLVALLLPLAVIQFKLLPSLGPRRQETISDPRQSWF